MVSTRKTTQRKTKGNTDVVDLVTGVSQAEMRRLANELFPKVADDDGDIILDDVPLQIEGPPTSPPDEAHHVTESPADPPPVDKGKGKVSEQSGSRPLMIQSDMTEDLLRSFSIHQSTEKSELCKYKLIVAQWILDNGRSLGEQEANYLAYGMMSDRKMGPEHFEMALMLYHIHTNQIIEDMKNVQHSQQELLNTAVAVLKNIDGSSRRLIDGAEQAIAKSLKTHSQVPSDMKGVVLQVGESSSKLRSEFIKLPPLPSLNPVFKRNDEPQIPPVPKRVKVVATTSEPPKVSSEVVGREIAIVGGSSESDPSDDRVAVFCRKSKRSFNYISKVLKVENPEGFVLEFLDLMEKTSDNLKSENIWNDFVKYYQSKLKTIPSTKE